MRIQSSLRVTSQLMTGMDVAQSLLREEKLSGNRHMGVPMPLVELLMDKLTTKHLSLIAPAIILPLTR